jgi:hypothetical protein
VDDVFSPKWRLVLPIEIARGLECPKACFAMANAIEDCHHFEVVYWVGGTSYGLRKDHIIPIGSSGGIIQ